MFEPENDLERSLLRAAAEPTHGPAFLRAMLNGTTFVALEFEGAAPAPDAAGKLVFPEGTKLSLRVLRMGDQEYLPFFTAASRARATFKGKLVVASNVTREFFTRYPGRQFVLNPGHENAWMFPSDEIDRLLAGQFGAAASPTAGLVVTAAAGKPPAAVPPPAAKAMQPKPAEPESVAPESVASVPVAASPAASTLPGRTPVIEPMALDRPILGPDETFVFKPSVTTPPKPGADKTAAANPEAIRPEAIKPEAIKPEAIKPEAIRSAVFGEPALVDDGKPLAVEPEPATSEPAAAPPAVTPLASDRSAAIRPALPVKSAPTGDFDRSKTDAGQSDAAGLPVAPPAPAAAERPSVVRAAASETLAAWRRLTGKRPASENPAFAAKPAIVPAADAGPAAQGSRAANEGPAAPEPAARGPDEAKPVAPPPAVPGPAAAARPAPPPGATIGRPDPYPVEIMMALTSVFQRASAIEAAGIGRAQFPGRPAHLVVALTSPESWDGLMERLGPTLRKALPPGSAVEYTPFPGGMFEEYFRTEAQPFFKKR